MTELGMGHYKVGNRSRLESPYSNRQVGSFLSLALEDKIGEKLRSLLCRRLGSCFSSYFHRGLLKLKMRLSL